MTKILPAALSAIAFVLATSAAQAAAFDPINGWTFGGDGTATAGTLVLTDASTGVDDNVGGVDLAAGARNVSGRDPLDAGLALQVFLGLADLGALDAATNGSWAAEGSAAKQTFTAAAGSALSFQWDLSTLEASSDPTLADIAFLVVDGRLVTLGNTLAATTPSAGSDWLTHTGSAGYSFTFASGGSHTVAFGVADVGSYGDSSSLAVTGLSLAAAAVPEPSLPATLVAGLGLLALVQRRRRR